MSIPPIVSTYPSDGNDLSAALVRELLRLSNSFNIEVDEYVKLYCNFLQKFDELRSEALVCLVCSYPNATVPLITSTITSESLSLGAKIETVQVLVTAAYRLSGLKPSKNEKDSETKKDALSPKDATLSDKTTITHPVRLALASKVKRYFRNRFSTVADLFISPLLHSFTRLAAEVSDAYENSNISKGVELDSVALRVLLPAQMLLALGGFMRCCVNTPLQK